MADIPNLDGSGIGAAEITIHNIRLPKAPMIAKVHVSGAEATYVQQNHSVKMPAPYQVTATLSQEDLTAFVTTKLPDRIRLKSLTLSPEGIQLVAEAVILITIRIQVTLKLNIVNETELHLSAENIDVLGAGPRNLITAQLQQLNPILSANDLPIKMSFTDVSHEERQIVVKGLLPGVISWSDFAS